MRGERERRRRPQLGRGVGPGGVEQLVAVTQAGGERGHQTPLAVQAMLDVLGQLRLWVPDVGAVSGADDIELERAQAAQRAEVRRQRPLAGSDEDAARAEHRVAREAGSSGHQADAVGRVSRGTERLEWPHLLTVARKRHRRAQFVRALGMVGVRVCQHHPLDPLASGRPNRLEVRGISRPGVDHPVAHNVGVGAVERERGRIGRPHPDDARGIAIGDCHLLPF